MPGTWEHLERNAEFALNPIRPSRGTVVFKKCPYRLVPGPITHSLSVLEQSGSLL